MMMLGVNVRETKVWRQGEVKEVRETRTVPFEALCRPAARASHETIVAISWISDLVSRAFVFFERSCESLARRQGCSET